LRYWVCLTPRNLATGLEFYYAKFDGSVVVSPTDESSIINFVPVKKPLPRRVMATISPFSSRDSKLTWWSLWTVCGNDCVKRY